MKKILLSAAAIMAFGYMAQAQEVKFGFKAGVNFSNLGGDAETEGAKTGLHLGGVAEIKLTENFSIQPELLYSMEGAKVNYESEETGDISEEDYKINYVLLPIMAKYYIMEGLSLEAGPQLGFLTKAEIQDNDVKDGFETINFSLNGGVAYDLSQGLFFQARYSAGISNAIKNFEGITGEDIKFTTTNIQLSVGYKF